MATNSTVTATFNEAVQSSTITTTNFVLKSSSGTTVTATASYNSSTNTATLTPSALLANSTKYTATISGVEGISGDRYDRAVLLVLHHRTGPEGDERDPHIGRHQRGV